MFAIIEVAGQQFKVEKDQSIFVHRLQEKEGEKITLNKVLLIEQEGTTSVGMPVVKEYHVKATVLTHLKGDKVKVFKKKRRKGYQVLNGHRQYLTEIKIDAIEKQKTAPKKATTKKPTATSVKKTDRKTEIPEKATTKATVATKTKKSNETKTSLKDSAPKTPKATAAKKKPTQKIATKTEKAPMTAKAKTTSKKPGTKKSSDTKDTNNKKESK